MDQDDESQNLKIFASNSSAKKFGTFSGVFTPNVLTILGVIMYLRLGWVVGNAGFLGAIIIILLAKIITLCTGLSMSSITTNIKIGPGGAYSIISKSLGLEAGGSIGIPLYIAQTLSASLYIIGFTEAWLRVFPVHNPQIVFTTAWLLLVFISYISANLAIKVQFLIMAILGLSLVSFFLSPAKPVQEFVLFGNYEDASFWRVFAIFFPAVTGIMAGANMSGDLKDPRRSIPRGTIGAILVTMAIYIAIAYMVTRVATPEQLRANQMIMVDKALWAPIVLAGIMGATLSSALSSILGAPRILQALAQQKSVPYARFFAQTSSNEPRNAIIFTGVLIEAALLLGNLDYLASLITMFFLITYGTLNLVVFLHQGMKFISFRPTFKIPKIVPLVGALGSIFIMFLINAAFSVIALIVVIVIYFYLGKKGLESEWGDIRGGLFLVLAERASRLSAKFPRHQISWKPDLLLPIESPNEWSGSLLFIRNITYPSGSIYAFTIKQSFQEQTQKELSGLLKPLADQGILVNSSVIEDNDFLHGAKLVVQTLKGGAFRPNILFLTIGHDTHKDHVIQELIRHASKHQMGVIILRQHPRIAFGMQKDINLWLRDKSPNWHLALLITLHLQLNWEGIINLVTASENRADEKRLYDFLQQLSDQARLPSLTNFHVIIGTFDDALKQAPRADINIFGLAANGAPLQYMREIPETIKSSCLFVKDAGYENALA